MLVLLRDLGMQYAKKNSNRPHRFGLYRCHCGADFRAKVNNVNKGNTSSCGCLRKQRNIEVHTSHGFSSHHLFDTWRGMFRRTTDPSHPNFKYYGAKGILVCKRWLLFANFIEDMLPSWVEGLTLDRINNEDGYYPENCRWATKSMQTQNTRKLYSTNKSGFRGVSWSTKSKRWMAYIRVNNKSLNLGSFKNKIDAAKAYDIYVVANNLGHTINGVVP